MKITINEHDDNKRETVSINTGHIAAKRKFKIAGTILLIAGAVACIVGFINIISSTRNGEFPNLFFLLMIGFPLLAIGLSLLMFGFRREFTKYVKDEVMPLVEVDARRLSRAVREGGETKKCECGEVNDPVSKFCKNCGKPLSKKCPDCGNDNDPAAQYCSNCGRRF